MKTNLDVLLSKSFDPLKGFFNSLMISGLSTICAVYFSSLTAYALVAYNWKMRQAFFTVIMLVMMIPAQASAIGFYKMMYQLHWTNNFLPLILPSIAAPAIVFFMRQYLLATLSMEMVEASRIDGAGEFYTFNRIVMPIMVPAIATQAIFAFVASWNNLFMPLILLTEKSKYTLPIMVSLLKGDIYKTEFGSIYMGLSLTVLPSVCDILPAVEIYYRRRGAWRREGVSGSLPSQTRLAARAWVGGAMNARKTYRALTALLIGLALLQSGCAKDSGEEPQWAGEETAGKLTIHMMHLWPEGRRARPVSDREQDHRRVSGGKSERYDQAGSPGQRAVQSEDTRALRRQRSAGRRA